MALKMAYSELQQNEQPATLRGLYALLRQPETLLGLMLVLRTLNIIGGRMRAAHLPADVTPE